MEYSDINNNNNNNNNNNVNEIPKKTRGRKKKIIPESSTSSEPSTNSDTLNNSYSIENDNKDDTQRLESLQIEQVKKKRGRKKKWEVETTTKLIENGPISFTENNSKEIETEIDENYKQQDISFGNLNIKIHSNKDNIHIDDIKQSLKNNKQSLKNNKQDKQDKQDKQLCKQSTKCKINITSSDLEDSDSEYEYFNNKKNMNIIDRNIKIMKYYQNELDSGNEILISPYRCYNCHHNFNNKPFFLPINYNSELQRFKVTGNFCSPNCVKAYALNSKIHSQKIYLIGQMYRNLYGAYYKIKPAPPIQCLKEYGGNMTIEQYRESFDTDKIYLLKSICSNVILDEIIEK